MLHEIRSDYAQIMSVLFLFMAGPGPWSLDGLFARRNRRVAATNNSIRQHSRATNVA